MRFGLIVILLFCFNVADSQLDLDPNFGSGGVVEVDIDDIDNVTDILTDSLGRIYVAGYSGSYNNGIFDYDYFIFRLDSSGVFDPTFGNNGIVMGDYPGFDFSTVSEAGIVSDGIVICGNGSFYSSVDSQHVFVAKYDFNGTLDSTFGYNGYFENSVLGPINDVACMLIQSDDILIGGTSFDTAFFHQESAFIIRLDNTGKPDSTFGGTGILTWSSQNGLTSNFNLNQTVRHADGTRIYDLSVTPWGEIMGCGYYDTGGIFRLFTICFDANGNSSATYGTGGAYIFDINPTVHQFAVKVDSVGDKMLVGAVFQNEGQIVLQTLDQYAVLGTAQTFNLPGQKNEITDLVSIKGSVLLSAYAKETGSSSPGYDSDYFCLYRMNKDLTPYVSFADSGYFQSDLLNNDEDGITVLSVDSAYIYMAGYINDSLQTNAVVSRISVNTFTNVDEIQFKEDVLRVYPNPAINEINIVNTFITPGSFLEIYDGVGKLVQTVPNVNSTEINLDISHLEKGLYYIVCRIENSVMTTAFTKQ